ncbi:DUF452 family protein [Thermosulfurimonas marina]|uniref:DUF452 family protein n=1 Tax=Thermosulfurimonas marina TaxID=2047767 RepID=A0A6H1WQF0_9BACT|nr:alpha/beta fold hydrolase [Thermosulfurimonas marina]QJA05447.1 DUF452 family protein [Thermosulfurimonas marina]
MKLELLGDPGAEELLVFFVGWGMDARPFEALVPEGLRVALLFDYRHPELPPLPRARRIKVLAWSLGVRMALECLAQISAEAALLVAGTGAFAHPRWGIDPRLVRLTLEGLKREGEGVRTRFFERMFAQRQECERFFKGRPARQLPEVIEELERALTLPPLFPRNLPRKIPMMALIPEKDRIFPPQAQQRFWTAEGIPFIFLDRGHFPFYALRDLREFWRTYTHDMFKP